MSRPRQSRSDGAAGSELEGRLGLLVAFCGGVAAALAHPPFGLWPGIFGFALICWSLDQANPRRPLRSALARGWLAGFAYLLIGTWWVAQAFFVDAATHGWQAPFAVLFTAGGIGVFWGCAGLAYRMLAPTGGFRVLAFAAIWAGFEWLRGHVLTGFPWDLPGEAWRAGSAPSQAASLFGAYGLTLITVAIGTAPTLLADRRGARDAAAGLALAAAALLVLYTYGAVRLSRPAPRDQALRLRIVQPGLGEPAAWTDALMRQRVERLMALTALPAQRPPQVIVWPEGALPWTFNDFFTPGSWPMTAMERATRPGQMVLDGGSRVGGAPDAPRYYNTLLFVRRAEEGFQFLGFYDKYRLVPFGEFLPFPGVFSRLGLSSLVQNGQPFSPGPPPAPLSVDGLPRVQPLICYEALFPGFTNSRGGRPQWIVNVSDDAWFGTTTGPLQHFNISSYRAIEEGLPLIRATPTGVSGIVDAFGHPRATLGLGRSGVIDGALPGPLATTLYARIGDAPFYVCIAAILSLALLRRFRKTAFWH